MAPEMIQSRPYSSNVDVWSLGVVLFELLTNELPFNSECKSELEMQITSYEINFNFIKYALNLSEDAIDLLRLLLEKDPARRISSRDVLGHPWISGMI